MLKKLDHLIINSLQKIWQHSARFSLFIVFFYFGFLKVIGLSPVNPLVEALFQKTISFLSFDFFY